MEFSFSCIPPFSCSLCLLVQTLQWHMGTVNKTEKALVTWPLLASLPSSPSTSCVTPAILATYCCLLFTLQRHKAHFCLGIRALPVSSSWNNLPPAFPRPSSSFLSRLPSSATPQEKLSLSTMTEPAYLSFPSFIFHHSIDHFQQLAYIHICLLLLSPMSEWKHYDDFVKLQWIPSP